MSATTSPRTRAPRGVPIGGQFQTEPKMESGIIDDPNVMSDEHLLAFTRQQGKRIAGRVGTTTGPYLSGIGGDADDHGQEVALRMLEARRRAETAALTSDAPVRADFNETKYGLMVAKFLKDIAASGALRYEDRRGLADLSQKRTDTEELLGRALTRTEVDKLADEIRDSYPPGRRPSVGFQNRVREMPYDPMAASDHDGDGAVILRHVENVLGRKSKIIADDTDDEADRLIELAEAGKKSEARSQVWAAIGAPAPATASINDGRASSLRKQMKDLGGTREVARRFANGTSTVTDDKVLFAAWGPITLDQKDLIASTLLRDSGYADELFSAAISAATASRKKGE